VRHITAPTLKDVLARDHYQQGRAAFLAAQAAGAAVAVDRLKLDELDQDWKDISIVYDIGVNESTLTRLAAFIRSVNAKRPGPNRKSETGSPKYTHGSGWGAPCPLRWSAQNWLRSILAVASSKYFCGSHVLLRVSYVSISLTMAASSSIVSTGTDDFTKSLEVRALTLTRLPDSAEELEAIDGFEAGFEVDVEDESGADVREEEPAALDACMCR